jgi:hypothetical protein
MIAMVIQGDEFQDSLYATLCILRAISDAIAEGVFHRANVLPLVVLSGTAVKPLSHIERTYATTHYHPDIFTLGSFARDKRLDLVLSSLRFAYDRDGRSNAELQAKEGELLASPFFLPLVAFAGVLPITAEFLVRALAERPLQTPEQALNVSLSLPFAWRMLAEL